MTHYDLIVVGAGLNGLAAAALSARAGRRTLVVEQRATVGGLAAAQTIHPGVNAPGPLHDTGSLATRLLAPLRLESHGLALSNERPALHVLLEDGRRITWSANTADTQAAIARISARDADSFGRYRAFCEAVAPAFQKLLLRPLPARRRDFLPLVPHALAWWRSRAMHELARIAPISAKAFLDQYFETDALKAALAIPALQAAFGGPFAPFGALHILTREALARTQIVDGPSALAAALLSAAMRHGTEVRTQARVTAIRLSPTGAACGVRLASGERLISAHVAAACSPRELFESLLPDRSHRSRFARYAHNPRSRGTTAYLALALGAPAPLLAPFARMASGVEVLERAFDHIKSGALPRQFALEIATSPDATALSVLVHPVPGKGQIDWTEAARSALKRRVVRQLAPFLPGKIAEALLLTPQDIEAQYRLPGGHLQHIEQAPDQMLVRIAPRYATAITGLDLCGSGAHPGAAAMCAPGALAARAFLSR